MQDHYLTDDFIEEAVDELSEDKHVVKFNFTDGFANSNITIVSSENSPSDETTGITTEETNEPTSKSHNEGQNKINGRQVLIGVLVAVVLVLGGTCLVVVLKRKHKNK